MRTVYMVTRGSYSDYGVDAIFSTAEAAQEFIDAIPNSDCNGITEMPLDPGLDEIRAGKALYRVQMLRDGTTEQAILLSEEGLSRYEVSNLGSHIWERTKAPAYRGKGIPDCMICTCFATDATHAVKIANEKRTQMIAEGKWQP